MFQIKTYDPEETRHLGRQFAQLLRPGDCVGLTGDLGGGKTVFISGVCAGRGYAGAVTSPTFTLMHHYPTVPPVFHFDCFRLKYPAEIATAGFEEFVSAANGIIIVEWADRIKDYFDGWTYEIDFCFDFSEDNARLLQFSSRLGGRGKRLYDVLMKALETTG